MKTARSGPASPAARLRAYFGAAPRPAGVFQITAAAVSGAAFAARERSIARRAVLPLEAGAVVPSFDRPNLPAPGALETRIAEAVRRLELPPGPVNLLVPELCARVFVFPFESLPASAAERERIVRWRIAKQMPQPPEDLRLVTQAFPAGGGFRLAVAAARAAVVREYEESFARAHRKIGFVTIPSLSLLRLAVGQRAGEAALDLVLVNVEPDSLGLAAVLGGEFLLYRQKSLAGDGGEPDSERVRTVVQEVLNTLHFLEDKEKRRVRALWVRSARVEDARLLETVLGDRTGLPVSGPEPPSGPDWSAAEANLFAPLLGQLP